MRGSEPSNEDELIPELGTIGRMLHEAPPIEMMITPYRAFCLVTLLQLALRHPRLKIDTPAPAKVAESMAKNLAAKLGEIDPRIAHFLHHGWDESEDVTRAEYEQFSKTGDRPQRNYSQLREDIRQEVLANSIAFGMACQALAQLTGSSQQGWAVEISRQANALVDSLSQEEVDKQIAQIDFQRDFGGQPPV